MAVIIKSEVLMDKVGRPLRVAGGSVGRVLSSQRISEDVLGVDSPQALSLVGELRAGLRRLCGLLC